jgi:hypothetical protein
MDKSNNNPRIQATTIVFTPTSTAITEGTIPPNTPHLRIQVLPNHNGENIASISVAYFNPGTTPPRLSEEITDEVTFETITFHLKGDYPSLTGKAATYMRSLAAEEVSIIMKEYTKYITDGVILDGFIAGIAAYMALLLLNENGVFTNNMPFQFNVLHTVRSGLILTRNMFRYLSLPLMALSRVANGMLLQLVSFVQSFINMWEPIFLDGPLIDANHQARISVEIIGGLSQHVAVSLARTQELTLTLSKQVSTAETRLQNYIDESLNRMRREISNLIIETRTTIKNISSEFGTVGETVKAEVSSAVKTELQGHIHNLVQSEINAGQTRTLDIVQAVTESLVRELVQPQPTINENEMRALLDKLEQRIELLYSKMPIEGLERIVDNESQDGSYKPGTTQLAVGPSESAHSTHGIQPSTNIDSGRPDARESVSDSPCRCNPTPPSSGQAAGHSDLVPWKRTSWRPNV